MNLQRITAGAIAAVNPETRVQMYRSLGYKLLDDGTQTPVYAPPVSISAQVQQLSWKDLQQVEGLNLSTVSWSVIIPGQWSSVTRPSGHGGDIAKFREHTWLVVAVLEEWPGWSRIAVTLQNDNVGNP